MQFNTFTQPYTCIYSRKRGRASITANQKPPNRVRKKCITDTCMSHTLPSRHCHHIHPIHPLHLQKSICRDMINNVLSFSVHTIHLSYITCTRTLQYAKKYTINITVQRKMAALGELSAKSSTTGHTQTSRAAGDMRSSRTLCQCKQLYSTVFSNHSRHDFVNIRRQYHVHTIVRYMYTHCQIPHELDRCSSLQ